MRRSSPTAVLVVLCGGLFITGLDNTIVNVALPSIQGDLGASTSALQWVVDAYSVVFAGCLLLAGSLGDRFGRRRILMIGLVVFGLGSAAAGLAADATALAACRALMGVGGALFGLFIACVAVLFVGGVVFAAGPFADIPGGPATALLAGIGLMSGAVSVGAVLTLVTIALINGLVWYGRLHYRLLKPALEPQAEGAMP